MANLFNIIKKDNTGSNRIAIATNTEIVEVAAAQLKFENENYHPGGQRIWIAQPALITSSGNQIILPHVASHNFLETLLLPPGVNYEDLVLPSAEELKKITSMYFRNIVDDNISLGKDFIDWAKGITLKDVYEGIKYAWANHKKEIIATGFVLAASSLVAFEPMSSHYTPQQANDLLINQEIEGNFKILGIDNHYMTLLTPDASTRENYVAQGTTFNHLASIFLGDKNFTLANSSRLKLSYAQVFIDNGMVTNPNISVEDLASKLTIASSQNSAGEEDVISVAIKDKGKNLIQEKYLDHETGNLNGNDVSHIEIADNTHLRISTNLIANSYIDGFLPNAEAVNDTILIYADAQGITNRSNLLASNYNILVQGINGVDQQVDIMSCNLNDLETQLARLRNSTNPVTGAVETLENIQVLENLVKIRKNILKGNVSDAQKTLSGVAAALGMNSYNNGSRITHRSLIRCGRNNNGNGFELAPGDFSLGVGYNWMVLDAKNLSRTFSEQDKINLEGVNVSFAYTPLHFNGAVGANIGVGGFANFNGEHNEVITSPNVATTSYGANHYNDVIPTDIGISKNVGGGLVISTDKGKFMFVGFKGGFASTEIYGQRQTGQRKFYDANGNLMRTNILDDQEKVTNNQVKAYFNAELGVTLNPLSFKIVGYVTKGVSGIQADAQFNLGQTFSRR